MCSAACREHLARNPPAHSGTLYTRSSPPGTNRPAAPCTSEKERPASRGSWTFIPLTSPSVPDRIAVIGAGRLGSALAAALRAHADVTLDGRGADGAGAELVLLCVPDDEIARAAGVVAPGRLIGHAHALAGVAAGAAR